MNKLTVKQKDHRVHQRVGRKVQRTSENTPSTHPSE
jgi:hypothetical protein